MLLVVVVVDDDVEVAGCWVADPENAMVRFGSASDVVEDEDVATGELDTVVDSGDMMLLDVVIAVADSTSELESPAEVIDIVDIV